MIKGFADHESERFWQEQRSRRLPTEIRKRALRRLAQLDSASVLSDLAVPPGNRLEVLKGERAGQHSIRINGQWRVCFRWTASGPERVEITDYH